MNEKDIKVIALFIFWVGLCTAIGVLIPGPISNRRMLVVAVATVLGTLGIWNLFFRRENKEEKKVVMIESHYEAGRKDVLATFWNAVGEVLATKKYKDYSLYTYPNHRHYWGIRYKGTSIASVGPFSNTTNIEFEIIKPGFKKIVKQIISDQIVEEKMREVLKDEEVLNIVLCVRPQGEI